MSQPARPHQPLSCSLHFPPHLCLHVLSIARPDLPCRSVNSTAPRTLTSFFAHLLAALLPLLSACSLCKVTSNKMGESGARESSRRRNKQDARSKQQTVQGPRASAVSAVWGGSRPQPCCAWRWVCAPPSRPALCWPLFGSLAVTCSREAGWAGGRGQRHGRTGKRGSAGAENVPKGFHEWVMGRCPEWACRSAKNTAGRGG